MADTERHEASHQAGSQDHGNPSTGKHGGHGDHGGDHTSHHAHMVADFRRRFWVSLALSVPIVALSPMIQGLLGLRDALAFPGSAYIQFAFSTGVFFYGGWPFLKGLVNEVGSKEPGMMTLIGVAILTAYAYSSAVVFGVPGKVFFWELATLIDVMLLGHWIEMRSVMGASGALEELVKLLPSRAHRLTESGETEDVPVSELQRSDRVVVRPGEKVPSDGVIREGRTSVNEAMITGESRPVEKGEGDELIGGSVNGDSAVTVEITRTGDDTYLSQVVRTVQEAQESRSRTQDLANRAALWLTIIALSAGAITLIIWLAAGREFVFSLERMVTVMVITCPHALGLAVPLVVAVSTSLAASRGLLIRERSAFERGRSLDAVIFDKTGTLTEGRFGVSEVKPIGGYTKEQVLRLAASLESRSEHPIARGIVQEAGDSEIDYPDPEGFENISGQGAKARVDGKDVKVVSPAYLRDQGIDAGLEGDDDIGARTRVFVLVDDAPVGAVELADVIREESKPALSRLREMGIQAMMLTGDNRAVADWVAGELALDETFAQVLPEDKAAKVREVRERGFTVAMVGDGVNDAPALVEADVGIAIGAGTDVAMEAADIVLVRSDPRDVIAVIELSRKTYRKMVQNLWWATGYNAVAIPLAAGVLFPVGFLLPPAAGALVMSLSTVIVAVNARLLGSKEPGGAASV